jgi:hypothetical protein
MAMTPHEIRRVGSADSDKNHFHALYESAWLIERAYVKPEMIHYFCFEIVTQHGITIRHWGWTSDNQKATRFGRKIDAELAWQCVAQRNLDEVEIIEHGWS